MKTYSFIKSLLFVLFIMPNTGMTSTLTNNGNFLAISDIHLDQTNQHKMEISPTKVTKENDLDRTTFEKLIAETAKNVNNGSVSSPKYIIILGDILGHTRTSNDDIIKTESSVFTVLKNNFPNTPILYTFGNNDSINSDYGPFYDATQTSSYHTPSDIAKSNADWNSAFLSSGTMCAKETNTYPCVITEDDKNGYYAVYIEYHLRLIALNTVMFSPRRIQMTEQDALTQLDWFKSQLKSAAANHESVLITMHIPPGFNVYDHSNFWLPKEQAVFLDLIKEYQHSIIGLLASHTHAEELKSIKDSSMNTIAGLYLIAGLSTSHGNAPSVKTFSYAKQDNNWMLTNYETFNFSGDISNLIMSKLYDYKSYYCSSEQTINQCLNNVTIEKMKKYFSAGNSNFTGTIKSPEDINLVVDAG